MKLETPNTTHARRFSGFSILELLVAVAITVLLLALVSLVITPVRSMVTIAAANMELSQYASVLEATMRDDVRRMNKNGVLVIKTQVIGVDETGEGTISAFERHDLDQMAFFSAGPWISQRFQLSQNQNAYDTGVSRTFRAAEARVWYGHMAASAAGADPINNSGTGTDFLKWVLGRQALLLTPGYPALDATVATHKVGAQSVWTMNNPAVAAVPANYPAYGAPFTAAANLQHQGIMQGTVDTTAAHTSADVRNVIMTATAAPSGYPATLAGQGAFTVWDTNAGTNTTPSGSTTLGRLAQANHISALCYRIYGQALFPSGSTLDRDAVMRTHATIAPNCSDFKIEWAGDFDPTYAGVDVNTLADGTGVASGNPATTTLPIHWYGGYNTSTGARKTTGNVNIDRTDGTTTVTPLTISNYTAAFGYDRTVTPWPRLIRVTVKLHDARGSLHDMYINTGGPNGAAGALPDGRTYQFVLEIPQ